MALHDELLAQEARTAPEPRTAEEWNRKLKRAGRRAGLAAVLVAALFKGLKVFALSHFLFHFGGLWVLAALAVVALVVALSSLLQNEENAMEIAREEDRS